jgi:hypothetical protein
MGGEEELDLAGRAFSSSKSNLKHCCGATTHVATKEAPCLPRPYRACRVKPSLKLKRSGTLGWSSFILPSLTYLLNSKLLPRREFQTALRAASAPSISRPPGVRPANVDTPSDLLSLPRIWHKHQRQPPSTTPILRQCLILTLHLRPLGMAWTLLQSPHSQTQRHT